MTQEEKNLLLRDLCARLPYGVKIGLIGAHNKLIGEPIALDVEDYENSNPLILINSNWLPYLRPMSSMTEEEEIYYNTVYFTLNFYKKEDWLLEHHFDFRGLIPMGLALESTEGMYD